MSALFISHSSADNAVAAEVCEWLGACGHRSLFLDFDPARGIPAGRQWEEELYTRLRSCQAVVVLCSAASSASAWCFAEITHARALGKPLFPLLVDASGVPSLLSDMQAIDLVRDLPAGVRRLVDGLRIIGLDAASMFDWDGTRPPYPGLLAFEADDAALYFGRESAIQSTIETLNRLRRVGGPRLLLLLGASSSGKSSLMRAGVVPRLMRDRERWHVAPPFRPLGQPVDALALAIDGLPGNAGQWQPLRDALMNDPAEAGGGLWRDRITALRSRAGAETSVLLVVDQLEEALSSPSPAGAGSRPMPAAPEPAMADSRGAFLQCLRAITAAPDGPMFVVATLRSDFLGAFQTHPALRGVLYEPLHLPQIDRDDLLRLIEGPAQVAGLTLEPGLAQAIASDITSDDALPLLAFSLREMYDRYAGDLQHRSRLTIDQYRHRLGGLQGAVARAADALSDDGRRSQGELDALHRAMLKLVRIDAEGRYVRQPRPWSDLPVAAHPLLEAFVQGRLLVSRLEPGEPRVLEVAHEALFRSWGRLSGWLAADREFLLWRERVRQGVDAWARHARDAGLLLRGPMLVEAQRWATERHDELDPDAQAFIAASQAGHDAARAAADRRRRRLTVALTATALLFGSPAAAAGWQWRIAETQRRLAVARQLNTRAEVVQAQDPVLGLLLTVQSMKTAWTPDAQGALLGKIDQLTRSQPSPWKPHPGPIRGMALSPDSRWLATAGRGHLQVQPSDGAGPRDLGSRNDHDYLHPLTFSPDGRWLAAACSAHQACVFDTMSWQPRMLGTPAQGAVSSIDFSIDSQRLAVAFRSDKTITMFSVSDGTALGDITTAGPGVDAVRFSPDGTQLAACRQTAPTKDSSATAPMVACWP